MSPVWFDYIEQDDEYMYFRVFEGKKLLGTVYLGKVKSLREETIIPLLDLGDKTQ